MTVFVSHADKDRDLTAKLVDLLRLGAGVAHHEIFCSSLSGMNTPNGGYFVNDILQHLGAAKVVLAVLSENYFRSQFCVAEVGAGQLLHHTQKSADFYSILVPPANFSSSLQGVLFGVQSGKIDERRTLDEMHDRVIKHVANPPSTTIWNDNRDIFLSAVRPIIERMEAVALLDRLKITEAVFEPDPTRTYKLKLRVVFNNETGKPIKVKGVDWDTGVHGAKLQLPFVSGVLQLWARGRWQDEDPEISVPTKGRFRLWVGIDSTEGFKIFKENDRLGWLKLIITISGYEIDWSREI